MMNVESEMGKIKTLDELYEFASQHGMAISLARSPSPLGGDKWFVLSSIRIVRVEGTVESCGKGENFTVALMNAARKIDKMLALGR